MTYTVDLLSTNQFVVPVVELIGGNAVDGESRLLVDNFRMVVARSLLFPRLTSFRIVPSEGRVEFALEDPKGREEAFTVEETIGLQDEESCADRWPGPSMPIDPSHAGQDSTGTLRARVGLADTASFGVIYVVSEPEQPPPPND